MVDRPQGSEASPASTRWSHDWTTLDDYVARHDSHLASLEASGTVQDDELSFVEFQRTDGEPLSIQIRGHVRCAGSVVIHVDKWLEVRRRRDHRLEVRAFSYSYHAWTEIPRRDLLRYDNAHGPLHRHFFDSLGNEVGVTAISLDELPTLDVVIEEAVALADEA